MSSLLKLVKDEQIDWRLTCLPGAWRALVPDSISHRPSRHRSPPGTPSAFDPPAPETGPSVVLSFVKIRVSDT